MRKEHALTALFSSMLLLAGCSAERSDPGPAGSDPQAPSDPSDRGPRGGRDPPAEDPSEKTRYHNGTLAFGAGSFDNVPQAPDCFFLHAKANLILSNGTSSWVRFEWEPNLEFNKNMRVGAFYDDRVADSKESFGEAEGESPLTVDIPKSPLTDRFYIMVWIKPLMTEPTVNHTVTLTHSISYQGPGAVLSQSFDCDPDSWQT